MPSETTPSQRPANSPRFAKRPRPVVLCILDGWGQRAAADDNSVSLARAPTWHHLLETSPHALLQASALDVGLPEGQMGNSEVGHMNLGAGRVVMQELPRIDQAVRDGSLAQNEALGKFIAALKSNGGTAHLLGLMSPGGVHAHQQHIAALARVIAEAGVPVDVHAFLDGRDTPPKSAAGYLAEFAADTKVAAGAAPIRIATVIGRFYAMDRDNRWDRVSAAYRAMVSAAADQKTGDAAAAVAAGYKRGETDEFVAPTIIGDYAGMADGVGILMANFRADRAREILSALLDPKFDGFARDRVVKTGAALGMVEYSTALHPFLGTIFEADRLQDVFGEVVSRAGLHQLRIAETEKYAHVTFFFNGGRETVFPGEERILVPSPKVATYDLQPEMSAPEVTDKLVEAIGSGRFDAVIVNYANTDMVGHSGDIPAAVKAVEAVDTALGRLVKAVSDAGGTLLVTADHGNVEQMRDPETGEPHTAHTTNPVPLLLVNAPSGYDRIYSGRLADIAPTLLELLGLPQPRAMTGHSLLHPAGEAVAERRAAG